APNNIDLRAAVNGEEWWKTTTRRWMPNKYKYESGHWYHLELHVRGDRVIALLDGRDLATTAHARLTHGSVAVLCYGAARFRDITVTAPDGKLLWSGLPKL